MTLWLIFMQILSFCISSQFHVWTSIEFVFFGLTKAWDQERIENKIELKPYSKGRIYLSIHPSILYLFCISAHRGMWSVTNYFLFNLTLADLMMATLNCIPSFIFMRDRYVLLHTQHTPYSSSCENAIQKLFIFLIAMRDTIPYIHNNPLNAYYLCMGQI